MYIAVVFGIGNSYQREHLELAVQTRIRGLKRAGMLRDDVVPKNQLN